MTLASSAAARTGDARHRQPDRARTERLVRAAERHRYDPWTDIDWSTPAGDWALHLPAEHLPLHGTAVWEAMSDPERVRYSRHECASLFATVVWLENILMVVVRYLAGLAPDHPSHAYLLVEVADECRHSMMFGEYVRRAGTPPYRPSARLRAEGRLFEGTQGVLSSFIAILAAEELVDASNRATARAVDLHPLPRRIAEIHVAEETRHRSFAKTFIAEQWPALSTVHKALVAVAAPVIVFTIAESVINPAVYRALGIPGGYWMALSNPRYWRRVAHDLGPFTSMLGDIGVINALSRPAWQALGLIGHRLDHGAAGRSPLPGAG